MVVKSDGSIWFTDPLFGISGYYEGEKADAELPASVWRIDGQTGEASDDGGRYRRTERARLLAR